MPTVSDIRIKSDLLEAYKQAQPEIFHIKKTDEEEEEEIRQKLTRAEMVERSRELRRLRIKESHQSAKAHRQNKIKSKKYHRILKKERLKQQIKEFELLQKTDPEAALRKIEQLDKSRIEERANQRHRNTGTWAKNLQVRAKYDKDVRKELADQIAISRELTAKNPIEESDDDDEGNTYNPEDDPDYDPFNPWLKSTKHEKTNEEDEILGGYRKYWAERNANEVKLQQHYAGSSVKTEPVASGLTKPQPANGNDEKIQKHKSAKLKRKPSKLNKGWIEEDLDSPTEPLVHKVTKKSKKLKVVDDLDDLFDDAEDKLKLKFAMKSEGILADLQQPDDNSETKKASNGRLTEMDLSFKKQNKRPKIDEALITENGGEEDATANMIKNAKRNVDPTKNMSNASSTENINPDDFAKVQPKHLQTALPTTIYTNDDDGFYEHNDADYENEDVKRLTLAEAFEDDDIVAQFERDKEEEVKKNGPQTIDLSLPGWGSWGGSGISQSKQKNKRRMILKFPATEQRKPENKGNVIIIENADEKLKKHRVAELPFPFTCIADYEQSIRLPLGQDFVPATAHKVLVRPAVTTRKGAIIKPMTENMLIKPARQPYTRTGKKIAELEKDLL